MAPSIPPSTSASRDRIAVDSHTAILPHVDRIRPIRIQSTPPTLPTSSAREVERTGTRGGAEGLLTPPITPMQLRDVRSTGNLHHASHMSPSTGGDLSFGEITGKDSKHAETLSTLLSLTSLSATSPPATPLRTSLDEPARGDPTTQAAPSPPSGPESAYTEFDTSILDYDLDTTNPLGTGLWSTVYRAQPTSSFPSSSTKTTTNNRLPTPPASPTSTTTTTHSRPRYYAIKAASRRDALSVLHHEARLLTHLSALPRAHAHVVAFFGFDARRNALVLGASSSTLEAFVARINTLEACKRREVLSRVWPTLVLDLVRGMEWLHEVGGVVHADVKPGNILLDLEHASSSSPSPFDFDSDDLVDALLNNNGNNNRPLRLRPRFCDFSASLHHPPPPPTTASSSSTPAAPAGAGTYAFMAPELLRPHALATTLLYALLGRTPYPAANAFVLREMVKQGEPLRWARESELAHRLEPHSDSAREGGRLPALACLDLALRKRPEERTGAREWRAWLEERMGRVGWGEGEDDDDD